MSSTDSSNISKKVGLAKLAKARSINNGLNSLGLESPSEGKSLNGVSPKEDSSNHSHRVIDIPYADDEVLVSVSTNEANTDLPNKVNVAAVKNTKMNSEPKSIAVVSLPKPKTEQELVPKVRALERTIPIVQSEDLKQHLLKENEKNNEMEERGSSKKSFLQNLNRKSFRKKKVEKERRDEHGNVLLVPNNQLRVPKNAVSRSRSLSRLSDVFSQVHDICLTPTKSIRDSEASHRSGRRSSWYNAPQTLRNSFEDDSSEEFDTQSQGSDVSDGLSSRRWSSLGQLSGEVAPLGHVKPSQAKQVNYLFGGLGSLLGTTELERYFPDRNVVIFIATWNMNGKEPPESLDDFLLPDDMEHMPDMYVIGTQESSGDRTEWEVRLQTTIGPSHVLFHSAVLGILHLTVFLRRDLVWFCSVPEEGCYSLRPGTYFKTKGAVAISFQFFGTRMLFVNTHLFAHEEKLPQRIQNYKNIVQNLDLPRNLKGLKIKRPKDVTNRYDVVFWLGDLNFRLVGPRDQILDKIKESSANGTDLHDLLWFDQLTQTRKKGEIFQEFSEGQIDFPPTFKFDVGTNHYDTSSKQRVPSYTDRILYKSSRDPIKCSSYSSCPLFKTSDHKPVWGMFQFKVRPGKDDVPLAAGLFQRDVYLTALKRRRRFFHQPSSRNCQMQ